MLRTDAPAGADPLVPAVCEVLDRRRQCSDVVTLTVSAPGGASIVPGQFNMLTAFGIGEAAISVSGTTEGGRALEHTVREVGPVTRALGGAPVGARIGVRGPFGAGWVRAGVEELDERDVVVVAGGIGLAPLRGLVEALARRGAAGQRRGRLVLAVGARSPDQLVFTDDLDRWAALGVQVGTTVDSADASWRGHVGVVTTLLTSLDLDPARTTAMVCGPEVMMRFAIRALYERGVRLDSVRLSLERNMQCGLGWCGHCQLGPLLLCRDGPVVDCSEEMLTLLTQRER